VAVRAPFTQPPAACVCKALAVLDCSYSTYPPCSYSLAHVAAHTTSPSAHHLYFLPTQSRSAASGNLPEVSAAT